MNQNGILAFIICFAISLGVIVVLLFILSRRRSTAEIWQSQGSSSGDLTSEIIELGLWPAFDQPAAAGNASNRTSGGSNISSHAMTTGEVGNPSNYFAVAGPSFTNPSLVPLPLALGQGSLKTPEVAPEAAPGMDNNHKDETDSSCKGKGKDKEVATGEAGPGAAAPAAPDAPGTRTHSLRSLLSRNSNGTRSRPSSFVIREWPPKVSGDDENSRARRAQQWYEAPPLEIIERARSAQERVEYRQELRDIEREHSPTLKNPPAEFESPRPPPPAILSQHGGEPSQQSRPLPRPPRNLIPRSFRDRGNGAASQNEAGEGSSSAVGRGVRRFGTSGRSCITPSDTRSSMEAVAGSDSVAQLGPVAYSDSIQAVARRGSVSYYTAGKPNTTTSMEAVANSSTVACLGPAPSATRDSMDAVADSGTVGNMSHDGYF
ncbi:hypothetical protein GGR57DRAFT_512835 [Xylariaceae sp. FL1272]|nr:hypothetical protein GGR57DRAFT_512835 [Xylariaceae sp. FL1272]